MNKRFYRSVWVSDVHLCLKDSRAELFYDFLDNIKCDYLYLVGDIIDVWAMKRKWVWPMQYNEIVHKLLKRSRKGARVIFIPGNHDEFFRNFVGYQFGNVQIEQRAIHTTADGRKLLVTHGDEFDTIVHYHAWLSHLGSWAYDHLITLNRVVNTVRRWCGLPYWSLSGAVKRRVKQAVQYVNNFEASLVDEARRETADGVVCGHVHQPAVETVGGLLYYNTGDWVENCTALVEDETGKIELIHWEQERDTQPADTAAVPVSIMAAVDVDPLPDRVSA